MGNSTKAPIPPDIRWTVWERDNFTCLHCGTRQHLSIDHIMPECEGGTLDLDNLQTLCKPCNSRKGPHRITRVRSPRSTLAQVARAERKRKEAELWRKMIVEEPMLKVLYDGAKSQRVYTNKPFCANFIWYGGHIGRGIKELMCRIVGSERRKAGWEFLRTSEAYDIAYDQIYQALPDCNHGDSWCWG